eukprot:365907-Chlamydomonas_euryale.AAC.17
MVWNSTNRIDCIAASTTFSCDADIIDFDRDGPTTQNDSAGHGFYPMSEFRMKGLTKVGLDVLDPNACTMMHGCCLGPEARWQSDLLTFLGGRVLTVLGVLVDLLTRWTWLPGGPGGPGASLACSLHNIASLPFVALLTRCAVAGLPTVHDGVFQLLQAQVSDGTPAHRMSLPLAFGAASLIASLALTLRCTALRCTSRGTHKHCRGALRCTFTGAHQHCRVATRASWVAYTAMRPLHRTERPSIPFRILNPKPFLGCLCCTAYTQTAHVQRTRAWGFSAIKRLDVHMPCAMFNATHVQCCSAHGDSMCLL